MNLKLIAQIRPRALTSRQGNIKPQFKTLVRAGVGNLLETNTLGQ